MKQYDVKISHAALSDMEQIHSYIADRLLEPDTAMGQYNRIVLLPCAVPIIMLPSLRHQLEHPRLDPCDDKALS